MTRFSKQLARGIAKVAKAAGEPIVYTRGSAAVELVGVRGNKAAQDEETGSETTVEGLRLDWIIEATEIKRAAGEIFPMLGDTITDLSGVIYRVTNSPLDGKPARWMRHRVAMRIHTLIVKGE